MSRRTSEALETVLLPLNSYKKHAQDAHTHTHVRTHAQHMHTLTTGEIEVA